MPLNFFKKPNSSDSTLFCYNDKLNNNIRPYPYPYKSAISISNDPDFTDFEFFEELMKFLNTDQKTEFGYGVNLELTSGTFLYNKKKDDLSLLRLTNKNKFKVYNDRLLDYAKNKWFDTNHSYADLGHRDDFNRKICLELFEKLNNLDIKFDIFTNHGNKENFCNVGDYYSHFGDDKESNFYHTDILKKNGYNFFWMDNSQHPIFKGSGYFIDPDSKKNKVKYNLKFDDYFTKKIFKDGNKFLTFLRFRGTGKDSPSLMNLNNQVSMIDWSSMKNNNGFLIFYQHLGILKKKKILKSDIPFLIKEKLLDPFYFLKEEKEKGNIWVSGLSRLLNYLNMIRKIKTKISNNVIHIFNKNNTNETLNLSGLTIYCNNKNLNKIYYNDKELNFKKNPEDETNKTSVSVEMITLKDIW